MGDSHGLERTQTFSGLPEAAVDSEDEDDESCPSHDSFHELKDNVRECLEKEPSERNADDLSILLVCFDLPLDLPMRV